MDECGHPGGCEWPELCREGCAWPLAVRIVSEVLGL
jgi:hypothetical protein